MNLYNYRTQGRNRLKLVQFEKDLIDRAAARLAERAEAAGERFKVFRFEKTGRPATPDSDKLTNSIYSWNILKSSQQ